MRCSRWSAALIAWRVISGPADLVIAGVLDQAADAVQPGAPVCLPRRALRAWLAWRPRVRIDDPRTPAAAASAGRARRRGLRRADAPGHRRDRAARDRTAGCRQPRHSGAAVRAESTRSPTSCRTRTTRGSVTGHAPWLLPTGPTPFRNSSPRSRSRRFALIAVAAWRGLLPRMWLAFTACFAPALARTVRSRRGREHLRHRAMGAAALRSGHRHGALAVAVRRSWRRLASRCCSPSRSRNHGGGAPAGGAPGRRCWRSSWRWSCCRRRARSTRRRCRRSTT